MKMIPNHVGFYVVVLLIVRVTNTHGQTGETSTTPPQGATKTYRVPLCCETNAIYTNGTCATKTVDLKLDLEIVEGDGTNMHSSRSSEKVKFEPYKHSVECDRKGYDSILLEKEKYGLTDNGNLYVKFQDAPETFPPESFCIAYDTSNQQFIIVCLPEDPTMATVQELYIPFVILSTICFTVSTGVYIFLLKAKDVHRKCFIGYSVSMIVTFAALLCLQKMNEACNCIGGIFMFSLISSFVWLTCLCMDLTYIVRFQKFQEDKTRMYIYVPICLVIPLIIVGYSVLPDQTPDVPQSFVKTGVDTCSFEKVNKETFFIPISLLISASGICLGYTSFVINTHNDPEDFEWIYSKDRYKFMLRSCFLVWVTTFIWLIETVANETVKNSGFKYAIDLIEAFQGVFVLIIFVLNKYIRKEIISVIYKKEKQKEQEKKYQDLLKTLGQAESRRGGSCRCGTQEE